MEPARVVKPQRVRGEERERQHKCVDELMELCV